MITLQPQPAKPPIALFQAAEDGSLQWVDCLLAAGAPVQNCPSLPCLLDFARRGGILKGVAELLSAHGHDFRDLQFKSR